MASEIEIANKAAVRIGATGRITSLQDDRPVAAALATIWNSERRATLREGSWNFATRRGTLAKVAGLSTADTYPYQSAFALPAGTLRLLEIFGLARDQYQLEGGRVLCDQGGPLYGRWIIDVTEPAAWDDQFADAFAARLAWTAGPKVYGGDFDIARAERAYLMALSKAKRTDAKENPPIEQDESDWILARLGTA